ncbi:Uncharacterized protein TCM_035620 [Theobroma cacao]|uniref:Uncharacterized protein n=1 Tax=Theobroma cacao TaxID=3641 RepID=A0A061FQF5_THECC|nr:Uncharacterized protein TCM_035620 [Theobroma cacao]
MFITSSSSDLSMCRAPSTVALSQSTRTPHQIEPPVLQHQAFSATTLSSTTNTAFGSELSAAALSSEATLPLAVNSALQCQTLSTAMPT